MNFQGSSIRSFVTRTGRQTASQRRGWEMGFPKWGMDSSSGLLNWNKTFGFCGRRVVEIGFGMGDSLIQTAQSSPNTQFVGIEVYPPGIGRLLNKIDNNGLRNIRVYAEDAIDVFEFSLAHDSIDAINVFFPDPWHKKRHRKRRLIRPSFIAMLAKRLRLNGIIHLVTDCYAYAEQMSVALEDAVELKNLSKCGQFVSRPPFRPITKFEKRAIALGNAVWELMYWRQVP